MTGWAVGRDGEVAGDHAGHLYEQLENAVLPLLQGDAARRVWMMKQAISRISGRLHSQRIMRRYPAEAYLR